MLPVFDVMQSLGNVDEDEMFRAFNMGIGMVFIINPADMNTVKNSTKYLTEVYEIGSVFSGNKDVTITC